MGSKQIGDLPDELGKNIQDFIRPNMWKVKYGGVMEEMRDVKYVVSLMFDDDIPPYIIDWTGWKIGVELSKKILVIQFHPYSDEILC